ncbi:MAG: HU family DNA-binding protein [Sphingobacteriales bacterium]|nr:HU family DNA-binding protein [Sphingobacteriales bacterium]
MNRTQLVDHIAKEANLTKSQASYALDALTNGVVSALKTGDKIAISGLGSFQLSIRPARTARNPKTGEAVQVPEKKQVKFKVAKGLEDSL